MKFPQRGIEIIDALTDRHQDLANGEDPQRRALIQIIGEQFSFELGPRWGNKKRAGLGDESRSKDAIAYHEDDGTCSVWDTINGATRKRSVVPGAEPSDPHLPQGEATFMPCQPVNHIGAIAPTTAPQTSGFEPDVRAAIGREEQSLERIEAMLKDIIKGQEELAHMVWTAPALPVAPPTAPAPPAAPPGFIALADLIDGIEALFRLTRRPV